MQKKVGVRPFSHFSLFLLFFCSHVLLFSVLPFSRSPVLPFSLLPSPCSRSPFSVLPFSRSPFSVLLFSCSPVLRSPFSVFSLPLFVFGTERARLVIQVEWLRCTRFLRRTCKTSRSSKKAWQPALAQNVQE